MKIDNFTSISHQKHNNLAITKSTMSARPRPLFIKNQPSALAISAKSLLDDYVADGQLLLRPSYQRQIQWNIQQMCDLISSIMLNMIVPGLLLYKYHADDEKEVESYEYECIDGQHRISVINSYLKGEFVDVKGNMVTWQYLDETSSKRYNIFYEENASTRAWSIKTGTTPLYMTTDEKNHFKRFKLQVSIIETPLSFNERSDLFTSLQNGRPVRGSDLYKNNHRISLVHHLMIQKYQERYYSSMKSRLTVSQDQYYLHRLVRFYLITSTEDKDIKREHFDLTDPKIKKYFTMDTSLIHDVSKESLAQFDAEMTKFFGLIDALEPGLKFTPVQLSAVFHYLSGNEHSQEYINELVAYLNQWAGKGYAHEIKMWEQGFNDKELGEHRMQKRREYFERCIHELETREVTKLMVQESPVSKRTIGNKVRKQVFDLWFANSDKGQCWTCLSEITRKKWDCGHIVAHALHGSDELDNLIPQCKKCNNQQGTENAYDFKKRTNLEMLEKY